MSYQAGLMWLLPMSSSLGNSDHKGGKPKKQAQEVHTAIWKWLGQKVSAEVAAKTCMVYRTSVTGAYSSEIAK